MSRAGATRPVGRRRGDPEATRAAILAAARRQFAEHGFDRATIRGIAADADVDPALTIHHFGSKRQLFVAAHALPIDPTDLLDRLAELPPSERGAALVRSYLGLTECDDSAALSLLRAAATNQDAARMLREFIGTAFLARADRLTDAPDAEVRVALVGAHLMGILYGRHVLRIEPLASSSVERLVALVGPTVQRYLDGAEIGS